MFAEDLKIHGKQVLKIIKKVIKQKLCGGSQPSCEIDLIIGDNNGIKFLIGVNK